MAALSESYGELAYWDEHSLDAQRLFDVACLVYGSDPEGWSHLVRPDLLPAQRARVCPAEFRQKSLAWDRLLEPHYR